MNQSGNGGKIKEGRKVTSMGVFATCSRCERATVEVAAGRDRILRSIGHSERRGKDLKTLRQIRNGIREPGRMGETALKRLKQRPIGKRT